MRLARVAACTAATALLTVATAAGTAGAATPNRDLLYTSSTDTGVVQLVLTLPDTVPALPGVPNPVTVTLLGTDAQGFHGATGADVATTHSYLAGGSLVTDSALAALLGALDRTVTADLAHPGSHSASLLTVPSNPLGLDLTVAGQTAVATTATRATTASSTLAGASLGSLRSLGLGAVLDPVLAQLDAALATLVTQASPLTTGLAAVPALPQIEVPNPLLGVLGGPATISTPSLSGATLSSTVTELPARVTALTDALLDGALVRLSAVDTAQSITPTTTSVTAAGHSKLAAITLFGGLVTVTATEAKVSAKAGLAASAAAGTASATLLELTVSDAFGTLLQAVASEQGLTAGLLDGSLGQVLDPTVQPIVAAVDTALDTVLSELTGLLTSLGSGASLIRQGTTTRSVSADGHRAEAHALPAEVTVGLPVAPDLLTLSIGKADAVAALSLAAPVVNAPTRPTTELPQTGLSGQSGLLALAVLTVGGLAYAVRRRVSA